MAEPRDVADAYAEGLDLGDQERGEESARNRAQAADHDDHKGVRNDRQVHEEVGGLARDLHRAAQAREERPEREHAGEQPFLVHAQRAGHFAILGRGAHQRAPARLPEDHPENGKHQRARAR